MFGMPGPMELAIIAIIVIVIFGPSHLPKMARSLGSALPSFKRGLAEANAEIAEFNAVAEKAKREAKESVQQVADTLSGKAS